MNPTHRARRALALALTLLMLAGTFAPVATAAVSYDQVARAQRLDAALAALERDGPTPQALAELRAAYEAAPAPLRASPAMQGLEEALEILESPVAAQILGPLLRARQAEDPEALRALHEGYAASLEGFADAVGLDAAILRPEMDALERLSAGFDLSSQEAFAVTLAQQSDEDVAAFVAAMADFVHRWNATAGTDLSRALDATVGKLARLPVHELRTGALDDPELLASYVDLVSMLETLVEDLDPANALPHAGGALTPEEHAAWKEYVDGIRANATKLVTEMGLDQDPFLGVAELREGVYDPLGASGPVAVDGVALVDELPAPQAPREPRPVATQRAAAAELGLPGVEPVALPRSAHAEPAGAAGGDDAPESMHGAAHVDFLFPGEDGIVGSVGAADPWDVYRLTIPRGLYVRVFLQTTGGNADLELFCDDSSTAGYDASAVDLPLPSAHRWASRSDATSARPYFDSLTFVTPMDDLPWSATRDSAFVGEGEHTCESGEYVLVVDTPDPNGEAVHYFLHGYATLYDGRDCPVDQIPFEAKCGFTLSDCAYQGFGCGVVNWARWGDRCKLEPRLGLQCRARHEMVVSDASHPFERRHLGKGNHGLYDRDWSQLVAADAENPVVFIHGVGGSYAHMLDMEGDGFYHLFNERGNKFFKELVGATTSAVIMIATALHTYKAFTAVLTGAASGSLIGAFAGLAVFASEMNSWASTVTSVLRFARDVTLNWRTGSEDAESHFWAIRDAGYETYWFEYNFRDNNARHGQIEAASKQLKMGLNAIQQDFYDRHRDDPGFPLRSPEDVQVDLVVHSMGGLVSRMYTVDQREVTEGHTLPGPLYEADVNKWISIQTPNMGSTPAKFGAVMLGQTIEDALIGSALEASYDGVVDGFAEIGSNPALGKSGAVWLLVFKILQSLMKHFFQAWLVKVGAAVAHGYVAGDLYRNRPELIRDNPDSIVTSFINRQFPALDVDHGIVYGVPLNGRVVGIGRFDLLVSSQDAKGPEQLMDVMATWPVKEDHASALWAKPVQEVLLLWLRNPDNDAFTQGPPEPSPFSVAASDGPALSASSVEGTGASLLASFGQRPESDAWTSALGARYVPDADPAAGSSPLLRSDPAPLGDRTARLERLAAERGLRGGAAAFASVSAFAREAVASSLDDGSREAYNASVAAGQVLLGSLHADRAAFTNAVDATADVAVLRAGHATDAGALLEGRLGEPFADVSATTTASQIQSRRVLVLPTGALAGAASSPFLAATLETYVQRGGTLLVLAQPRGADLALLPGAPQGFGYAEEQSAFRGSVVFGEFTPALAELPPAPDLHVDGSFTRLPENATVLLASARSGRPVVASYPWGEGRVVLAQVAMDWAAGRGEATDDELRLARGLLAEARRPGSLAVGAPGEDVTLDLSLGPDAAAAVNLTLVLVDAGAKELARVAVPPAWNVSWTIPGNLTRAGHYEVDAVLDDGTNATRLYGVAAFHAAHYAASPGGYAPVLAPASLDVTSAGGRAEAGQAFEFALHVANRANETRGFTVAWWFPAHAAAHPAGAFGQGPAVAGAPAAWEDNFRLRQNVTVPPGETVSLAASLANVSRSDALAARLLDAEGNVLAEARQPFVAYHPSVEVVALPERATYASGESARVHLQWRDRTAPTTAEAYGVALTATLRDPHGLAVAAATVNAVADGATRHANVTLAIPADAVPGGYALLVEAARGPERLGGGGASLRVPGQQVAATPTLPASFAPGEAATVTYEIRNPGLEPVTDARFDVRLLDPAGALQWSGVTTVTLAPGASATRSFSVVPASAAFGRHSLEYEATVGDVAFRGATPILSSLSARVTLPQPTYRAGDALHADARIANDGRFALPLQVELSVPAAGAAAVHAATLQPGESVVVPLDATLPATLAAGEQDVTLSVDAAGATRTYARSFSVPPARVAVALPDASTAAAGANVSATLSNSGGVAARVPWTMQLLDARGLQVASARGAADLAPGASAAIGVAVPLQAAEGTYDLRVFAETLPGRPALARKALQVDGLTATLDLAAPGALDPGATGTITATPDASAPLDGATLTLEALRPAPLPAWRAVPDVAGATSAADFDGATWLGTAQGLLRLDPSGAVQRFGVADGLPAEGVTDLAVALGRLYVGTAAGLGWVDADGAWGNLTQLGELPTRSVRALAGTPLGLFVATEAGVARLDGAGWSLVPLPAQAAADLAADDVTLWAALADVQGGFPGEDALVVPKKGATRATPSVAVAPNGDVHLAYADEESGDHVIRHARLPPGGAATTVSSVVARAPSPRGEPALVVDRVGNVHVAWHDAREGDADVYYRKLAPDGSPLTPETVVAAHRGTPQQFVRMALDHSGGVVLVWQDARDPNPEGALTTKSDKVWMARLALDGSVLTPPVRLTGGDGFVLRPQVAVDLNDRVHAAWSGVVKQCIDGDPNACYPELESFYGKWSLSGEAIVREMPVSRIDQSMSFQPGLAVDRQGDAHLVYEDASSGRTQLAYSRVDSMGNVQPRGVILTSEGASPRTPTMLARGDAIDVAWTDWRSGRSEAYHAVLNATSTALGPHKRVNGPAEGATGTIARNVRLAASTGGILYAVWDDYRDPARVDPRLAVFEAKLLGRGVARVDLATGDVDHFRAAGGLLPSDDALAVALDHDLVAVATRGAVTLHDRASGGFATLASADPMADGPLAVRGGRAYLATAQGIESFDPATGAATVESGGPAGATLVASVDAGLLAGTGAATFLRPDARDDVVWRATLEDGATSAAFTAPSETGRLLLRARLVNEPGQTLATAERSLFVLQSPLSVTIQPPATPARPGEPVTVALAVANRGDQPLRGVEVRLLAGDAPVLDDVTSLAIGETRLYEVPVTAQRDVTLLATAAGAPANLAGAGVTVRAEARDHLAVAPAAVVARILAPQVAAREPVRIDALVQNHGALPVDLAVSLDGGAPRALRLSAGERATLEGLATRVFTQDALLALRVTGDADLIATHRVAAGERVRIADVQGLAGPAGARVVALTLANDGPLDARFPLEVLLDGAPLPAEEVALAGLATATRDLALTLAPGAHDLEIVTPWERRAVRLAAADEAIPELALGNVATDAARAHAEVVLTNLGPGDLVGTLEADFGFHVARLAVDLPEGATLRETLRAPLDGVAPGDATVRARLVRNGAPVAEDARAFVVPGPAFRFVSANVTPSASAGGEILATYVVENAGLVAGSATLAFALAGADAQARPLALAPGERATLSFASQVEVDAASGVLAARATLGNQTREASVQVTGARILVGAATDAPAYARGDLATLTLLLENPGDAPLDLVADATLGLDAARATVRVPAGGNASVPLALRVPGDDEARWRVALASGRVLAEGGVRVPLAATNLTGVSVSTDADTYVAGSLVTVNVTTDREGRVDLVGPGFRDAFTLNGTTVRAYHLPAHVPAGRYALHWHFDATGASGGVGLGVVGPEARSGGLALSHATASPGETVRATWTLSTPRPLVAWVHAWVEDTTGGAAGAQKRLVALPAGETPVALDLLVPGVEPGEVRVAAELTIDAPGGPLRLVADAASLRVRGVALREASLVEDADGLRLRVESVSDAESAATTLAVLSGGAPLLSVPLAPGVAEIPLALPEAGSYDLRVVLATPQGNLTRDLVARVPGVGTPPVTTLRVEGANLTRADGMLVLAPAHRLLLEATDEGAGVAGIELDVNGAREPADAPLALPPGEHVLVYRAWDRASNVEAWRTLRLVVDGEAPDLALDQPRPGAVHAAGAVVVQDLALADEVVALGPVLADEATGPLDLDGDGHLDADELAEGTDPSDPRSVPSRWSPTPPLPAERPVVVLGALRVRAALQDDGTGHAEARVLLDGREVARDATGALDLALDLSGEAPGDHVLEIVAVDGLGNARAERVRLLVVPLGAEGLARFDPMDARLPPAARALVAWLQGLPDDARTGLAGDMDARLARHQAAFNATNEGTIQPLVPPVVSELPEHLEREVDVVLGAVDELQECGCLVP